MQWIQKYVTDFADGIGDVQFSTGVSQYYGGPCCSFGITASWGRISVVNTADNVEWTGIARRGGVAYKDISALKTGGSCFAVRGRTRLSGTANCYVSMVAWLADYNAYLLGAAGNGWRIWPGGYGGLGIVSYEYTEIMWNESASAAAVPDEHDGGDIGAGKVRIYGSADGVTWTMLYEADAAFTPDRVGFALWTQHNGTVVGPVECENFSFWSYCSIDNTAYGGKFAEVYSQ